MSKRQRDFLPILGGKVLNSNIIQHNKMARIKKGKKKKHTKTFVVQEGEVEDMLVKTLAGNNTTHHSSKYKIYYYTME